MLAEISFSEFKKAISFYSPFAGERFKKDWEEQFSRALSTYDKQGNWRWSYEDVINSLRIVTKKNFTIEDAIEGCNNIVDNEERRSKVAFLQQARENLPLSKMNYIGNWGECLKMSGVNLYIKADLFVEIDGRQHVYVIFPRAKPILKDIAAAILLKPFALKGAGQFEDSCIHCFTVPKVANKRRGVVRSVSDLPRVEIETVEFMLDSYCKAAGTHGSLF